jgi:O-antigen/teichoic acid export membrane protein
VTSDSELNSRSEGAGYALLRGSAAALAGRLIAITLSLIQAFGLLRLLGPDLYGHWTLLATVLTATAVLDFGLPGAVEQQVARNAARRDPTAAGRGLVAAAAAIGGCWVVAQTLVLVWGTATVSGVSGGVVVLPAAFAAGLLALVPGAAVTGLGRYATFHTWRSIGLLVGVVLTVGLAAGGVTRLDALIAAHAFGSLVTGVACWLAARRAWPQLALAAPRKSDFVVMARLGGGLQAASLAPLTADYAFRLLIATRFGSAAAGIYDLASRMSIVVRSLAGALASVLVPHSAAMLEATDQSRVSRLHARAVSLLLLFALPSTIVLVVAAGPLAAAVAPEMATAEPLRLTLQYLLVAHLVAIVALPGLMIGRAAGRPLPEAAAAVAGACTGVAGSMFAGTLPVAAAVLWTFHAMALLAAWRSLSHRLPVGTLEPSYLGSLGAAVTLALGIGASLHYIFVGAEHEPTGAALGWLLGLATFAAIVIYRRLLPSELRELMSTARSNREGP